MHIQFQFDYFSVIIGPILSLICAVGNFLALANIFGNPWVSVIRELKPFLTKVLLFLDFAI